jgi:hypothetical protein
MAVLSATVPTLPASVQTDGAMVVEQLPMTDLKTKKITKG